MDSKLADSILELIASGLKPKNRKSSCWQLLGPFVFFFYTVTFIGLCIIFSDDGVFSLCLGLHFHDTGTSVSLGEDADCQE